MIVSITLILVVAIYNLDVTLLSLLVVTWVSDLIFMFFLYLIVNRYLNHRKWKNGSKKDSNR